MLGFKVQALSNPLFKTILEVRISDLNYGNHVGNDAMLTLLQEARGQFLKSRNYGERQANGEGILVTHAAINYLGQAYYGDSLLIQIEIGQSSKTSMELIYQVDTVEQSRKIARALTTITFYDYGKKKVLAIPPPFRLELD